MIVPASKFLASGAYRVGEIAWGTDHHGDYWTAKVYDKPTDNLLFETGTYSVIGELGKRAPKADQVAELKSWGIVAAEVQQVEVLKPAVGAADMGRAES